MTQTLDHAALATLFTEARSHNGWTDAPVSDDMLESVYGLTRMAPTSANCSPARFVFVRTPEGKAKLAPALSNANHDKTMSAPVTVICASDKLFYDKLPALFPHASACARARLRPNVGLRQGRGRRRVLRRHELDHQPADHPRPWRCEQGVRPLATPRLR